jgi:hypothetical protein
MKMGRSFHKANTNQQLANRVWIELERPRDAAHAESTVKQANIMLRKLGITYESFMYDAKRNGYLLMKNESGTYTALADRGEWFNLDKIAEE